jgi:hypothetical protein
MKKNIFFIVAVVGMFIILYQMNRNNPSEFVWKPTYDTYDKQPFGAYVFDKLLEKSWKDGYIHSYESFSDLYNDNETPEDKNILIVCNRLQMTDLEVDYLLEYTAKGGNAFIAADDFDSALKDTLDFEMNTNYLHFSLPLNLSLEQAHTSVSFSFLKDSISGIPRSLLRNYFIFSMEDEKRFALATDAGNHPVMIRYPIGKGNLILSSTPLFFTNYVVLHDSIHSLLEQSLACLKGKPLVRTEYYANNVPNGESTSVFRYLLSQPSLKWACYLVMITLFLFMIFTAKRKQRAIPVIRPPGDKMLDFVRSISALYLMRNNNADIILKKYIYWSDELRKKQGIDPINEKHDPSFIKQFSTKTGMPENEARQLFLELDGIREHTPVGDDKMMNLITKMKIKEWKNGQTE